MDNTGGYRTEKTMKEYMADLLQEHNIAIVHQHPHSPVTNMCPRLRGNNVFLEFCKNYNIILKSLILLDLSNHT